MPIKRNLSRVCTYRLNETYHTLYEKQYNLGISDEFLHSTIKLTDQDTAMRGHLVELLEASRIARDNIITWYLKQTLVELNVTISLLTAKIKFIEYKLGLCDGLDLHQACSLSLVDFCNILADLTVINTSPTHRKTMHAVSAEANIPVWLSHYRNQICHVPSEGPCIAILVPLVQKSLNYMKESFWLRVVEHETFDEKQFKKIILYVSKLRHVTCIGKRKLQLNKGLGKKRQRNAERDLEKYSRVCLALRRSLIQHPQPGLEVLARFMVTSKIDDESRNNALLIIQLIHAKCFEPFLFKLLSFAEQKPDDAKVKSWLKSMIVLVCGRTKAQVRDNLNSLNIVSLDVAQFIQVSPIKCCQIAYRLIKLEGKLYRKLVIVLRHKLLPILGKEKVLALMKMTTVVAHDIK